MLNGYKWIAFEYFSREAVAGRGERLRFEHRVISFEQLLNNVQNRTLACTGFAVQNKKLLNILRIAGHDGTDGPFDLRALFFGI